MIMRHTTAQLLCSLLAGVWGLTGVWAQAQPQEGMDELVQQVLANASGNNGIEELVAAYQVSRSAEFDRLLDQTVSFEVKRKTLASSDSIYLYRLIEKALSKPLRIPEAWSESGANGASALLRRISRLLAARQRLDVEDGAISRATLAYSMGQRLARPLRTINIGSWFESLLITDRLRRALYRVPPPIPQADYELLMKDQSAHCLDLGALKAAIQATRGDALRRWSKELACRSHAERDAVLTRISADYRFVLDNIGKPLANWAPVPTRSDGSQFHSRIAAEFSELLGKAHAMVEQFAYDRFFATTLAIRQYPNTHLGKIPVSLADLKIGDLAVDPINHQPFMYKVRPPGLYSLSRIGGIGVIPALNEDIIQWPIRPSHTLPR